MTQRNRFALAVRRLAMLLTIFAIGLSLGYYLPRYGLEWMLGGMAATAFLTGFWIRSSWD